MRTKAAIARSIAVLAVLGAVAALYFARAIFLPLALAILLTSLLAPAMRLLRDWGLPREPAVVLAEHHAARAASKAWYRQRN